MSENDRELRDWKPRKVESEIRRLLDGSLSDAELRAEFERLSAARAFGGLTWLWGPELYERNRVLFRPFILNHFSNWMIKPGSWRWHRVSWKGDIGTRLDRWLERVEEYDDAELFQKLYPWKHGKGTWGSLDEKAWRADVCEAFQLCQTAASRAQVLRKFDLPAQLDESTALRLYRADPASAGPFILKHLAWGWGENRALWDALFQQALQTPDDEFAYRLYRRQVSVKQWSADVAQLAQNVTDPTTLCEELEKRHPDGYGLQLGMTLYGLVEQRGRDVLPYLRKHLHSVFRSWWGGRDGYKKLVRLAAGEGWWDLWSGLVRGCAQPEEYNAEVKRLLKRAADDPEEVRRRLLLLTGVGREWNFGPFGIAHVQQLEDAVATRMYAEYPELLRGPFKMHVAAGWFGVFPKLTDAVLAAEDESLIDYLASRAITRVESQWGWGAEQVAMAREFSRYYEKLRDDETEFSRRAVNVLGQVPAYSIWQYGELVRTNRLARMFYERSSSRYLSDPTGVRDLLEAAEIHAQAVGFRALGLDCDAARQLAAANLDLLQATLLRPLHRTTRLLAFRALENAAVDELVAARILNRCREALDLPDTRYPKEHLVGLIGRLLHRYPALRSEDEQPVVYGVA